MDRCGHGRRVTEKDASVAWADEAQREAERDELTCRVCKRTGPIDKAITIWRDGRILYGICDACIATSEFLITPTERGIEIRGRRRRAALVG